MGFKEIVQKMGEKQRNRKEMIRRIDEELRMNKIVEERQKSANQRELERYLNEDNEKSIKHQLEFARKKRDYDIKFNHNPINAKNIMKAEWEVMKEKNMFKGKDNLFTNQPFIHKSGKGILKGRKLHKI